MHGLKPRCIASYLYHISLYNSIRDYIRPASPRSRRRPSCNTPLGGSGEQIFSRLFRIGRVLSDQRDVRRADLGGLHLTAGSPRRTNGHERPIETAWQL
jgi:hypothetical protein